MNVRSLIGICCLLALPTLAQSQLQLPSKSPGAKVSQTAGLTEITVEYSSPGVKGRKIWGALVPYGQVWRAGANEATRVTFSKDVTVGDTAIAAGTYSFHAIPTAKEWTLILNKTAKQWGSYEYAKEADVVRVNVTPKAEPNRERLAYMISDFTDDMANIDLEWEKVRVSLPVKLKTKEQALANVKATVDGAWQPMFAAARYMLENKDYPTGLTYIEKSIAVEETWQNDWMKAQLLAGSGKYKDALMAAEKAQALGQKNADAFGGADDVKKALTEWKGKS